MPQKYPIQRRTSDSWMTIGYTTDHEEWLRLMFQYFAKPTEPSEEYRILDRENNVITTVRLRA